MAGAVSSLPPPPGIGGNVLAWCVEAWRHMRKNRVKAGNGMRITQTEDGIILSAKDAIPFAAGFTVEVLDSTNIRVRSGYACDRFDGADLFDSLDIEIGADWYVFAKYIHDTGWQKVSAHVVQNAAALPSDDASYVIFPIAKITWNTTLGAIDEVTQYDVGNLYGSTGGYRAFFAKITARTGSEYTFAEQKFDAGVWSNRAGGYSGTDAREASGIAVDLAADIIVPMVRVFNNAGVDEFIFTLAHWLHPSTTTSLPTSGLFVADTTTYVFPRTDNLEIPMITRTYRDGSRLALFARTLKYDCNGNPRLLGAESKVVDCHVLPDGTTQWDVPTWDATASPDQWIADVVRGHA